MPKELTHWYVAKRVAEAIGGVSRREAGSSEPTLQRGARSFEPAPRWGKAPKAISGYEKKDHPTQTGKSPSQSYPTLAHCIINAPNTFLLGSVGPDFLFYYLAGPEKESFRKAAMILHGRDGGNTLRPFVSVAEAYGGRFGVPVGSFLLGYLVHVVTDSVFHPLVLYTVGKGEGRPQYEHHLFESVLDLFVWKRWGKERGVPRTLGELTRGMEEKGELSRDAFLHLLGVVSFLGGRYSREALRVCLKRFERIQSWFWSSFACQGARLLKVLNPELSFFEASFYQQRFHRYTEAFDGFLEYRHPVTGEPYCKRIEDLVLETVEQFLQYAPRMETLFQEAVVGEGPESAEGAVSGEVPTRGEQPESAMVSLSGEGPESGEGPASEKRPVGGQEPAGEEDYSSVRLSSALGPGSETGGMGEKPVAEPQTTQRREVGVHAPRARSIRGSAVPPIGFRSLRGPNLETGLYEDKADQIRFTRPEGLEGLLGPYGYRYGLI